MAECPVDEMNRPCGWQRQAALQIPPEAGRAAQLSVGWREELATCQQFALVAHHDTAAKLMAEVGCG